MLVSSPEKYNFKPISTPFHSLREHSYTIMDTSEGQVFLHVNHYIGNSKYGNVYVSDATVQKFEISLKNNVREQNGQCDFEKMLSVEGVRHNNNL